jgi:hypothetical protein
MDRGKRFTFTPRLYLGCNEHEVIQSYGMAICIAALPHFSIERQVWGMPQLRTLTSTGLSFVVPK